MTACIVYGSVRPGRDYDVAMEQPARWRHLPWDGSPPASGV